MQVTWLHQKGSKNLVLFYAGWALDHTDLSHLSSDCDVLMLRDYRDEGFDTALISVYSQIDVLAYSMGVAVAARQLGTLRPRTALALCGAVNPRATIGAWVYDQTADQLSPQSLKQFARRASATPSTASDIPALRTELHLLAERPAADPSGFGRVFACKGDRIFTPAAMEQAWPAPVVTWFNRPHMPFAQWQSWQEILA